jgi:hypothetical protein
MKATKGKSPYYLSYLLRLWGVGKGTESTWRASLESPMTGERRGFASLKDLFAFLQAQVDGQTSPTPMTSQDAEPTGDGNPTIL